MLLTVLFRYVRQYFLKISLFTLIAFELNYCANLFIIYTKFELPCDSLYYIEAMTCSGF